jgi:2-polyprenyl-3-methyl-5-hydroxy-6-metoxy-1,4-benzoquinol methylase
MAVKLITQPDGWRSVEPKPTREELSAFYANEYFQKSHGTYLDSYSEAELAHRDLIARLLLHAIAEGRGPPAPGDQLLEIGCGEGWFLSAAGTAGYEVRGLDFSADGLKRFHPELLDRTQFGDAFELLDRLIDSGATTDVCVTEHVIEHVLDPVALLDRLKRLLRPGGVAAITAPNDFSATQAQARDSGMADRDFWVVPPQHLNYFNTDNLPRLLERSGFEVRIAYASFPIDWFLLHPGSNYVANPAVGKAAHAARMAIDTMLAARGMEAYFNLARAFFTCGAGRSQTIIAAHAGA